MQTAQSAATINTLIEHLTTSTTEAIGYTVAEFGFIGATAIVSLALAYKYFSRKIRLLRVDSDGVFSRSNPLEEHKLFESCDYWLALGISRIRFPREQYPIRARLYEDLVRGVIASVKTQTKCHLNAMRNAHNGYQWREVARQTLKAIVDGYEAEFRRQGTPEIVIEKFGQWHRGSLAYIEHNITSLGDTTIADSEHKTSAFLSAVLSSTKTAFYDTERTLITLNGELSGKKYKGETIE